MNYTLALLLMFASIRALPQAITGLNFNHWYDPQSEVQFTIHLVRYTDHFNVHFTLQANQPVENYTIEWEKRETYTQRDGTTIDSDAKIRKVNEKELRGVLSVSIPEKPLLVVAKVTRAGLQSPFYFFKMLEANYPVNGYVVDESAIVTKNYLITDRSYQLKGDSSTSYFISYYNSEFTAASPPFAEKEGRVDRFLFHDSLFRLQHNNQFQLNKTGLYLFQKDTTAAEGFAFRLVTSTFPKFTKIEDLLEPLIYVTTRDEFSELQAAGNDKVKFDKVILDITRDKDRAKNFMRSYFRRVELANLYFSSYKEGWKTDRGMIYIIFGQPDEVTCTNGHETWFYRNYRTRLTFVKSGSIYNPENYVLARDNRFMEPWFTAIDLWRKSRF